MKMPSFIIILLCCAISTINAQSYSKSEIIDDIPVKKSNGETFALYLPTLYNPSELSAIVFVFDPSGRGANGLKPFISSAEKFNYILVCSNNAKNGPYKQNFDITNRLFFHVFSTLKIDQKQMYTAGFSGGSRLACTVAVLTGAMQGVIACGAGFPNEMDKKPSINSKFSYVGLVGDEDMNYQEMLDAKVWLDKFNVDNELFTYEDGHHWPPQAQIERAFKWLELQAYKRRLRKPNTNLIEAFYDEELAIADSLSRSQVFRAVKEYERLNRNYNSKKNTEIVSEKINVLKKSKRYKEELKIREHIEAEEAKISSKFLYQFSQESVYGESRDNFVWWKKELKKLEEKYLKSDDYFIKKMGERVHFKIKALAYETSVTYRNTKRLDRAIYCDKLLTIINPDEPWAYYRLAEAYARNNDAKNTRISLKVAVDKGFKKHSDILKNPLFKKFKGNKKFDMLINSLDD